MQNSFSSFLLFSKAKISFSLGILTISGLKLWCETHSSLYEQIES